MAEWDERVASHEALRLLGQIDDAAGDTKRKPSRHSRETLDRIRSASRFFRSTIDQADPQLVAPGLLDGLTSPLSQVAAQLEAYRSTGELGSLANANAYLDQALQVFGWPGIRTPRDAHEVRETVTSMRRSAGQLLNSLSRDVEAAVADAAELKEQLAARRARLAEATKEVKAELSTAVEPVRAGLTALQGTIEQQKARLDSAIATFQVQFSSAEAKRAELAAASEAKRAEAATAATAKRQEQYADMLKKQTKAGSDALAKVDAAASEKLKTLARYEKEAQRLVSKTGSAAVSGGYVRYADGQAKQADIWRVIGFALLIVVVVIGAFSVGLTGSVLLDFHWLASRLLIVLPLVGLAFYSFSQSSKHRVRERDARQNELDFAALDPYIELLPDDQRDALKAELARRAFFRTSSATADSDPNIVGELLAILKEAVKKA